MTHSQYKNRSIFPYGELNRLNHQWKPIVAIFWTTTTQKIHSINDLPGTFETEREALAFAAQAGKAWVDSQPLTPARVRKASMTAQ